ncbi:MAG TPA: 5-(carboxyamino)imidazole ribonucleotide synthase [Caldimonas sp.]|nr:5-(carboxyamino)imidazole ribonucleotide synthase [Caldimonas sp.]
MLVLASEVTAAPQSTSASRDAVATTFIAPGATLGVIGGGQLGRMFAHAAQRSGYAVAVLDPDEASPAGRVADLHIRAAYLDVEGLARLAEASAAVTTEFENVPAAALQSLAASRPVAPAAATVAICQDRRLEKAAFAGCDVPCAPFAAIECEADLAAVDAALLPGILKTARLGYDGKGQRRVADRLELSRAFADLGGVACVLEQRLDLAAEVSVIVARNARGEMVELPVQENLHRDGILAVTEVPAPGIGAEMQAASVALARRVCESIGHVGVLCVELFVLGDGRLVANEMAPRPHNSGHYSIDACDVSQFDLQVRVLTGAPLVAPRLHSAAVMLNLLGDLWWRESASAAHEPDWRAVLALPGACLHLYGKREARRGRKMGHLTFIAADAAQARDRARAAGALLGIAAEALPVSR